VTPTTITCTVMYPQTAQALVAHLCNVPRGTHADASLQRPVVGLGQVPCAATKSDDKALQNIMIFGLLIELKERQTAECSRCRR
jgi:hypothetical protein